MAFPGLGHASSRLFLPVLSFSFLFPLPPLSTPPFFPPSFPVLSPLSLLSFSLPLPRMGSFPGRAAEWADGARGRDSLRLKGGGGPFWRMCCK